MERKKLKNLDSSSYEHPFDRSALEALKSTPGLPALIKAVRKYSFDKIQKIIHTGSYLKVGQSQFPHIYEMYLEACRILDFAKPPKLYVAQLYEINAYATCYADPIILLGSGCLDALSDDEILFIIGHELGHVKSQHLLYNDLAHHISYFGALIGEMTLGIGGLLSRGLELALLYWSRMSELTCDRAGLLTTQDFDAALSAIAKMAGAPRKYLNEINVDAFLQQAREFEGFDFDALDKIAKVLSVIERRHPWTVMRASELDKWHQSGGFDDILNNPAPKPKLIDTVEPAGQNDTVGMSGTVKCPDCGSIFAEGGRFCPSCGYLLRD